MDRLRCLEVFAEVARGAFLDHLRDWARSPPDWAQAREST